MKFTKEEKILLTMYAYVERSESIEAFQKLTEETAGVSEAAHALLASVTEKLGKMSDGEFDQIEFFPDELIPMILDKSVEEVTAAELYDVVQTLKGEFEF